MQVAIVGQAFPYTPIANPRYFVSEWTFGIQEEEMQKVVDEARGKGAQAVVLLSHNGMDVDLKLASRVTGIDAILGGHTHDGVPQPTLVANRGGRTLVTNAGSNGKFLGVLDLDVKAGKVADFRYRLVPVFGALLPADPAMDTLIREVRAPYAAKLDEKLAVTEGLLYRRGNFNGTVDQLILDALMAEKNAPIAFSPGFRWGTSLLPGQAIRMEHLMDQTAITYPVRDGERDDRRDDQDDPRGRRRQPVQPGSVLSAGRRHGARRRPAVRDRSRWRRWAGASPRWSSTASRSTRRRSTRSSGWAPVSEEARAAGGEPVWDVVARNLRAQMTIKPRALNLPKVAGVAGNPGLGSGRI